MKELKTKKTSVTVESYLEAITDDKRKSDCEKIHSLMKKISGDEGKMWGSSIAGYGSYHYKYASGQEGDWMATGFSNRKHAITLYIMSGFDKYDEYMAKLGKFKTGKSCLYVKQLEDIDMGILEKLIKASFDYMTKTYPSA